MCALFANLYVLLTWGPHMVYKGTPYIFHIYLIRCGWLGSGGTVSMSCGRRAWNIGSVYHASVVRGCAADRLIQSYRSLLVSQAPPLLSYQLSYQLKLHACRANNNYFLYIYIYIYLLFVFGIVFNCIIQNNSYCSHWQYFSI